MSSYMYHLDLFLTEQKAQTTDKGNIAPPNYTFLNFETGCLGCILGDLKDDSQTNLSIISM